MKIAIPCASALIIFLTACSSEPSASDIDSAVRKSTDDANKAAIEMATAFAGAKAVESMKDAIPQLKICSAKKVGCKEDGTNAYKCDVEYDAEQPLMGRVQTIVPMRFVKGSNGWAVAN